MRAGTLFVGAVSLAGCVQQAADVSVPRDQDIVRLEATLARHPCVGDLGLWERNYRFSRKAGLMSEYSMNPDLDVIEFHFRRAETISIAPGRKVMPWGSGDWPDSRPTRTLDGQFKIASGAITVSRCVSPEDGPAAAAKS